MGVPVCSVIQMCLTLCNPMDSSPPSFSVRGIIPPRILEWVAIYSSSRSPNPGIKPALRTDSLPSEPPGKLPIFPYRQIFSSFFLLECILIGCISTAALQLSDGSCLSIFRLPVHFAFPREIQDNFQTPRDSCAFPRSQHFQIFTLTPIKCYSEK